MGLAEETAKRLFKKNKFERSKIISESGFSMYVAEIENLFKIFKTFEKNKYQVNLIETSDIECFYVNNYHRQDRLIIHLVKLYLSEVYIRTRFESTEIQMDNFLIFFGNSFHPYFLKYFFDVNNVHFFKIIVNKIRFSTTRYSCRDIVKKIFEQSPSHFWKIIIKKIPDCIPNFLELEKIGPEYIRIFFEKIKQCHDYDFHLCFYPELNNYNFNKYHHKNLILEIMHQIKITNKIMSNIDITVKEMIINQEFLKFCQGIIKNIFNTRGVRKNLCNAINIMISYPIDTFVEIIDEYTHFSYANLFTEDKEEFNIIKQILSSLNKLQSSIDSNTLDKISEKFSKEKIVNNFIKQKTEEINRKIKIIEKYENQYFNRVFYLNTELATLYQNTLMRDIVKVVF